MKTKVKELMDLLHKIELELGKLAAPLEATSYTEANGCAELTHAKESVMEAQSVLDELHSTLV